MRCFRLTASVALLLSLATVALGADAADPAPDPAAAKPLNPLAVHSLESLSTTIDRPLFSPSRRPPPPPAVQVAEPPAPPPPPPPPPNIVLVGVVMDGDSARAMIRSGTEQKILRAQIGDEVGGWKVSQIEGRRVVLSLDDRFATFTLFNRDDQQAVRDAAGSKAPESPANPPQQSQRQQNLPLPPPDAGNATRRHRVRG
jgi:hypothetical protein